MRSASWWKLVSCLTLRRQCLSPTCVPLIAYDWRVHACAPFPACSGLTEACACCRLCSIMAKTHPGQTGKMKVAPNGRSPLVWRSLAGPTESSATAAVCVAPSASRSPGAHSAAPRRGPMSAWMWGPTRLEPGTTQAIAPARHVERSMPRTPLCQACAPPDCTRAAKASASLPGVLVGEEAQAVPYTGMCLCACGISCLAARSTSGCTICSNLAAWHMVDLWQC